MEKLAPKIKNKSAGRQQNVAATALKIAANISHRLRALKRFLPGFPRFCAKVSCAGFSSSVFKFCLLIIILSHSRRLFDAEFYLQILNLNFTLLSVVYLLFSAKCGYKLVVARRAVSHKINLPVRGEP